ncbi:MAG: hypothetical protein DRJ67_00440 [Thermoprotei archaeon]|nr:MAG: hypothetical protein DRJ67_00440 [Thermoprotei archaeon]
MNVEERFVRAYYRRRKVYGIRNHVLILPTTLCVNRVAEMIWEEFRDVRWGDSGENRVVVIRHASGCCHVGFERDVAFKTLLGVASHPNVHGVLLVSLGCGQLCKRPLSPGEDRRANLEAFKLYDRLVKRGVKVYWVNVQERALLREYSDGLEQAVELGKKFVRRLVKEAEGLRRVKAPINRFVIGVGNGASDPTSGLFANPALGYVVDHLVKLGASVVFSQTTEVLGAEKYLFRKVRSGRVANKLKRLLETAAVLKEALLEYLEESDPTPGNIASGISTLTEKSLGSVLKIGHDPGIEIADVLPYAHKVPRGGGLYFMDAPGEDVQAITGMVAGGAHVVVFTTGLGTPVGSPVSPVIKVTANKSTYERLRSLIDVYLPVEELFEDGASLREIALKHLYPAILDVMSGARLSRSEELGQADFDIRGYWLRA